jgi:predicted metalloenzyme YecM
MIELPGPQEHVFFNSGLEHLEMVVGNNFKNFKERYNNAWNGFDDSGLHNQPVYVNLSKNRKVKFHEYSLEEVLKMEKRKFIETNQAD